VTNNILFVTKLFFFFKHFIGSFVIFLKSSIIRKHWHFISGSLVFRGVEWRAKQIYVFWVVRVQIRGTKEFFMVFFVNYNIMWAWSHKNWIDKIERLLLFSFPYFSHTLFFSENVLEIFGFLNLNWIFPLLWDEKKWVFHQFRFYNPKTSKNRALFFSFQIIKSKHPFFRGKIVRII